VWRCEDCSFVKYAQHAQHRQCGADQCQDDIGFLDVRHFVFLRVQRYENYFKIANTYRNKTLHDSAF